jgi:hypothetical protein
MMFKSVSTPSLAMGDQLGVYHSFVDVVHGRPTPVDVGNVVGSPVASRK